MDKYEFAGWAMFFLLLGVGLVIISDDVQNSHIEEMAKICGCNVRECGK